MLGLVEALQTWQLSVRRPVFLPYWPVNFMNVVWVGGQADMQMQLHGSAAPDLLTQFLHCGASRLPRTDTHLEWGGWMGVCVGRRVGWDLCMWGWGWLWASAFRAYECG